MPAELLAPQDSTLWNVQTPEAPLQIGGVAFFEAGPLRDASGALRMEELCRHVTAQLERAPRLRQRLVALPFDQGPVWMDDEGFDVREHVRSVSLPHPVTEADLRRSLNGMLSTPLDPTRPLWEMRVIDGVDGDRVAVVLNVSHVVVDGMGLLGFVVSMLGSEPRDLDGGPEWRAQASQGRLQLLAATTLRQTGQHLGSIITLARGLFDPRLLLGAAGAIARAGTGRVEVTPRLPVTRPVGRRRDFAWVGLDLDALVRVKRAEGVTLNDVVLAVVGGGLEHYLEHTGSPLGDHPSRVIVPVSNHGVDAGEEIENRFSMMLAAVPLSAAGPLERLRAVHVEMERRKRSSQSALGPLLFAVGDLVPNWLLRVTGPALLRRQPFANYAVTNLPGSREPLSLLGAPMLDVFPFITVTGNVALMVGVISYWHRLEVGFTVDADAIGDLDLLVQGVERAARELVEAADA